MVSPRVSMPVSPDIIARTCLCRRIQRAGRAVGRRFDDAFRSAGINNWQFTLLMSLTGETPLSVNEIASELGMDHTTTTRNLRPLERRGLLEIRPDAADGRVRRILLTEAGRQLLSEATVQWERVNREVAASLSPTEVETLRDMLDTIASEMSSR
jgi:DNA-binding MarR family transcriptional regulator